MWQRRFPAGEPRESRLRLLLPSGEVVHVIIGREARGNGRYDFTAKIDAPAAIKIDIVKDSGVPEPPATAVVVVAAEVVVEPQSPSRPVLRVGAPPC